MRGTPRRVLLVVLDGVADRPAPELDGLTPLEAADTPTLDRLAAAGANGTMDVGAPGTPLSSDRAHTYLFGYRPEQLPGRGVLEARGLDVAVPDGGVACSASFARTTLDDDGWTVTDRHPDAPSQAFARWGDRVTPFECDDATVRFEYTWKERGIVTLTPTGGPLSAAVTDADPFETGYPVLRTETLDSAADGPDARAADRTARALSAYTRWTADRLAEGDAAVDAVLCKWAGQRTTPEPFETRHGLRGCSLTPKPVLAGLAETLGMSHRQFPEEYDDRPGAVADALDEFDFVHAHYPEPDEVAHAGGPATKRDELEAIDASLGPLAERALADEDLVTVVTADHTTPSGADVVHSGEPVPVTMVGAAVRRDDVERVGERPAGRGGLGRVAGRDLLRLSRAAADHVLLDGLRRSAAARDYPNQSLTPLWRDER